MLKIRQFWRYRRFNVQEFLSVRPHTEVVFMDSFFIQFDGNGIHLSLAGIFQGNGVIWIIIIYRSDQILIVFDLLFLILSGRSESPAKSRESISNFTERFSPSFGSILA